MYSIYFGWDVHVCFTKSPSEAHSYGPSFTASKKDSATTNTSLSPRNLNPTSIQPPPPPIALPGTAPRAHNPPFPGQMLPPMTLYQQPSPPVLAPTQLSRLTLPPSPPSVPGEQPLQRCVTSSSAARQMSINSIKFVHLPAAAFMLQSLPPQCHKCT